MRFFLTEDDYTLIKSCLHHTRIKVAIHNAYPSEAFKQERLTEIDKLIEKMIVQHAKGKK